MIQKLKKALYFHIANYFRFFATFRLKRWKPRVIIVTGSLGKTTLLNLIESQLGNKAHYSHEANSSFGIPFDILGLRRKTLLPYEWLILFFLAPIKSLFPPFRQKIYIVEADVDRPGEGGFLAAWLKPEVTLWLSSSKTHSEYFDHLVSSKKFSSVEEAVAYEFGHFIENTQKLCLIPGDNDQIENQLNRTNAEVIKFYLKDLKNYKVTKNNTHFDKYKFSHLLPQVHFYALKMTLELLKYLKVKPDLSFSEFHLPPGRSSIFKGIKQTTLIDSSYNANLDSMRAILSLFSLYPSTKKWAVLGDMLEQGESEEEEHLELAKEIYRLKLDQIILMGPRVEKYTYPYLKDLFGGEDTKVSVFLTPDKVLEYLNHNIRGGETILFKGARFLDGVVEKLLLHKSQEKFLCRREKVWEKRKKKFGL